MSTKESIRNDAKMEPIYKQERLDDLGDLVYYLKELMESPILTLMRDMDETYWAETHQALAEVLCGALEEMEWVKDDD